MSTESKLFSSGSVKITDSRGDEVVESCFAKISGFKAFLAKHVAQILETRLINGRDSASIAEKTEFFKSSVVL